MCVGGGGIPKEPVLCTIVIRSLASADNNISVDREIFTKQRGLNSENSGILTGV